MELGLGKGGGLKKEKQKAGGVFVFSKNLSRAGENLDIESVWLK
jgi:hypothetical protein